jgi:hypothetical protein
MIWNNFVFNLRVRSWVIIVTSLGLAYLIGLAVTLVPITYREIIAFLLVLTGILILASGRQSVWVGFIFWIFTLGIGYRTLPITNTLKIHPAEILLWGILLLLLVQHIMHQGKLDVSVIPKWYWLIIPFLFLGWVPSLQVGRQWDILLSEFRNFLLLFPLFIVGTDILKNDDRWRGILLVFFIMGVWVAGMGNIEYFFPPVRDLLPGFVSNTGSFETHDGFQRAWFSFWGTSDAVFVLTLALPFAIVIWYWYSKLWQRFLIALGVILYIIAIIISGHRDAWVFLMFQFLLWGILQKRTKQLILYLVILGVLVPLIIFMLPTGIQGRVATVFQIAAGDTPDSSSYKRQERANIAVGLISRQPLGNGWGAAGWVHSDFLQVGANLGLIPGLIFLGGYLITGWRLYERFNKLVPSDELRILWGSLFLTFVTVGGILAFETVIVLPQLVLPVWFVWVLVEIWLYKTKPPRVMQNV